MKRNATFFPAHILLMAFIALAVFAGFTAQATCTPPPAGLIAWWPGEGNATDYIGNNSGTLSTNGVAFVNGKVGQAFRLDGTNGYVQIPDSTVLKPTNVTVEAWVWLDPAATNASGGEYIIFKRNTWTYLFEGYVLAKGTLPNGDGTYSDRFQFLIARNGNQVTANSATVVQRGVWYHVAGTYDGNTAKLFVNGVQQSSVVAGFALDYGTLPIYIGASGEPAPYQGRLAGIIDEPSIYNRALTTNEIGAIYNADTAGKCQSSISSCTPLPAGLIAWWPGEGNATDYIGNNSGTLSPGGVAFANGKVGQGFRFNGTNGYLQIPDSASLKPTNITIEAWVWFDPAVTGARSEQVVFKKNTWNAFFEGYSLLKEDVDNGNGTYTSRFSFVITSSGNQIITRSISAIQRGVWYHVAATYDGSTQKLFVNGAQEASAFAGFALDYDTQPVFIGSTGIPGNYVNYLAGIIDEPSIYNRALSTNEIIAIYNAGNAGKCLPQPSIVPVISSVLPASAASGTVITISGNNFSPVISANIVHFGAVTATVLSASPTSLTVSVPNGATYAPLTVTINGLVAYSSMSFEPTFAGGGTMLDSSTFAPGVNLNIASAITTVIADLNGDGKPDLAMANVYANSISICQNIGSNGVLNAASFSSPVVFPVGSGSDNPISLTVADVNGDGRLDLLVADRNGNRLAIFQNISAGGMLGTNSFSPPVYFSTSADPRQIAVCDLDGDGHPDIISANNTANTLSILRNLGLGGPITTNSFAPAVDLPLAGNSPGVVAGDLDGDGKPDLAVADSSGFISLFRNHCTPGNISTNTFDTRVDLPAPNGSLNVVIGDLDGDGKPELIATAYLPQTMSVYRNLSVPGSLATNSFGVRVDYPLAGRGHTIALSDLNGDGKPDIAEVTELSSVLSVFQNISNGGFTNASLASRVDFGAGWNAWGVALGDLDGDGRPDAVFGNVYDNTLTLYKNISPMGNPPVITTEPASQNVAAGSLVTFNAIVQGAVPVAYQWSYNGTNLNGATNSTLTLSNVQPAQAGSYSLQATNNYGSATSSNAVLTVFVPTNPPAILSQTPSQIVLLGSTVNFGVSAGGTGPLSYFWMRNGVLIPGATNFNYSFTNAQLSDSGSKFNCLVTNIYGFAASTNVTLKVIDGISNDLCSGAVLVTNFNYTNSQSTIKATSFGDPVPDCVPGFGNGVWYQFTPPGNGLLTVDTFGSDFDTGLAVYAGACDSLAELACNDDTGGVNSLVTVPVTAGAALSILAGGYSAHAGNLAFHLNFLMMPTFVVQPTNESVVVSSNAIFSPTVNGTQPISYQWYFNGTPLVDGGRISGATNLLLMVANVQTNDAGSYQVVASNLVGVATSSVAMLTPVILPPTIFVQPTNQSVFAGSNVTFTAAVMGTSPFNYQWYREGTLLSDDGHYSGVNTASLTISNLAPADAHYYSLVVSNVSGSDTSMAALLTVLVPPVITLQPLGRSVPPGLPTVFNAFASGIPTPVYQWQLNGTNLPGATSSSFSLAVVNSTNLGFYHLVASNAAGLTVSSDAQLTFGTVATWGLNASNECLPPPNLSNVVAIAGTLGASFAVRTDGSLAAWGSGAATNIPAGASNIVGVATSGSVGNYALRADGTVIGWNGISAPALSNIVAVVTGKGSSTGFGYALRAEGTLMNWGVIPLPDFPAGAGQIKALACGVNNMAALRNNGTILVSGTGAVTNVPASATNVIAVAVGYTYAMALRADGTVVVWGTGTITNLPAGLTNIIAISAGNYSPENVGLAVQSTGKIFEWGDTSFGQTTPPRALTNLFCIAGAAATHHGLALVNDGSPVILHPPIGLTAYTGRNVTLHGDAVGAQPLAYQWLCNGTNIPGATNTSLILPNLQLSNAGNYQLLVSNNLNTAISLPVPLTVISNGLLTLLSQQTASQTNYQGSKVSFGGVTILGSGPLQYQWYFSTTNKNWVAVPGQTNDTLQLDPALAIHTGNYYVAVSNQFGGLTNTPAFLRVLFAKSFGYFPTDPPFNVTNATAIAVGSFSQSLTDGDYLVLKSDGKISSWGAQIVYGETNFSALSNSIVTAIAAGNANSLALKSDGTVFANGNNSFGQTNVPFGLSGVIAIAAGDSHNLALKADGTFVGWGQNTYGELTNTAATNVVAIAAGGQNSMVLRADGTVFNWGFNGSSSYPIPGGISNVIAIACGSQHFLALRANGTVVGWGSNPYGQTTIPANWTNIVAISAAANHSVALRNDGTVLNIGGYNGSLPSPPPADLANVIAIASGSSHDLALFGTRAPVFTVLPWNRTVPNTTTSIVLVAKCSAAQPVSYQWKLNGAIIPGATNDTLVITGPVAAPAPIFLPIPAGNYDYQIVASNAYGVAITKPVKISVVLPLAAALDTPVDAKGNSTYNWISTGSAPWFGETNITHDGVDAARSGAIGASQETILQTTVATNFSGHYNFWWKVSSEQFFDTLEFRVNGVVQASLSGEVDWQLASITAPAGTNVLQWRYSKDYSFDDGLDAAFVDQFVFVPDAPIINVQPPALKMANMGDTVSLSVSASGAPLMHYQWKQNGVVIVNGPTLTLNNVSRAQNGTYFVTVTNAGGATVSSNVVVKVLVPQLLGAPKVMPDGSLQLTSTDANGGLLTPEDLANFEAQASTNLIDWVTLPDALTLTNGMVQLQDNARTNFPTRYYRVIEH